MLTLAQQSLGSVGLAHASSDFARLLVFAGAVATGGPSASIPIRVARSGYRVICCTSPSRFGQPIPLDRW
jgi:hypothetical protein